MTKSCRIALVGDYNPEVTAHRAIPETLRLAGEWLGVTVEPEWLHTSTLRNPADELDGFGGVWCVPASPYENTDGVLATIRYSRENEVPFFGSCGGFQHAILEYARNVLGIREADHAETNPAGGTLVIAPLACALVEKSETLHLANTGIVRQAYGCDSIEEEYRCSYGINPRFQERIFSEALRAVVWEKSGEVRAAELEGHPFFVGTLFQSERRALRGETPPLAVAFVAAVAKNRGVHDGTPREI